MDIIRNYKPASGRETMMENFSAV
jgi:hypothetical protein